MLILDIFSCIFSFKKSLKYSRLILFIIYKPKLLKSNALKLEINAKLK